MSEIKIRIEKGNLDDISDKQINEIREKLYNFMCFRRELLNVNEYTPKETNKGNI